MSLKTPPVRRPHPIVLSLVLAACRSAPRPVPPATVAMPEAPPPADTSTVVRALAAPAMPRCEAGDPLAVASLTPGLAASPALARRSDGGLVAFVVDPHRDGHPTLRLLPLDREGSSVTDGVAHSPIDLDDAGPSPALPALVATRDGYLLAWRQGAPGQHRIALRALGPDGTPGPAARLLAPTGVLGAPALGLRDDRPVVAVARSVARSPGDGRSDATAWAAFIDRIDPDGSIHTAPAPEGGAFTGEAPRVAVTARGVAVWATVARDRASSDDERALVRLDDDRPTLVARDLDHTSLLPIGEERTLVAWRARVARRDTAARAAVLSADDTVAEAPLTLATYRGASDLHVALAPVGQHRIAAISLSTLADDAGATVNLSLLDDNGRYLGRAPILTGFLSRTAEFAVATTPGADDALLAVDGRDVDDGTPQLILTRVRCHATENVDPLDLPPGTFVQEPIAPEAPRVTLARPQSTAADMACTARGSGDFVAHVDANTNASALRHTASAVVVTPSGATLLAVVRGAPDAPGRLVASTLNAQRRLTPLAVGRSSASDILAASRIPGGAALAVISYPLQSVERLDLVTIRGAAVTHSLFPTLRDPSAAAIVPETGEVYVVAKTNEGSPVLARVAAGRPPVVLSTLRDGDTLLDAVRDVDRTALLLARPDTLGEDVSLTLAARFITAAPSREDDPFADPLGHVVGTALWQHLPGRALAVLSRVGPTLRIADLDRDTLRNPRSLLAVHPSGGEILASAHAGTRHWLALATGIAPEGQPAASLTFAALDRGNLAGAHFRLPDDASAIAGGVSLDADEAHLVALYPRSAERGVTWRWIDLTCNLPGAAR